MSFRADAPIAGGSPATSVRRHPTGVLTSSGVPTTPLSTPSLAPSMRSPGLRSVRSPKHAEVSCLGAPLLSVPEKTGKDSAEESVVRWAVPCLFDASRRPPGVLIAALLLALVAALIVFAVLPRSRELVQDNEELKAQRIAQEMRARYAEAEVARLRQLAASSANSSKVAEMALKSADVERERARLAEEAIQLHRQMAENAAAKLRGADKLSHDERYLAAGASVRARLDIRAGGTVVVAKGSSGVVQRRAEQDGKWIVQFTGIFGASKPVGIAVLPGQVEADQ